MAVPTTLFGKCYSTGNTKALRPQKLLFSEVNRFVTKSARGFLYEIHALRLGSVPTLFCNGEGGRSVKLTACFWKTDFAVDRANHRDVERHQYRHGSLVLVLVEKFTNCASVSIAGVCLTPQKIVW